MKPFAESCEQNKLAILDVIRHEFANSQQVLEIGSGTGQHAVFFADQLPLLTWQCSDVEEHHPGIQSWINDSGLNNVLSPLTLNVATSVWPTQSFDAVFSANTVHIMGWPEVEKMMAGIGQVLTMNGVFCLYGPFNIDGNYSSESNASFDIWLKQRDPKSAIRDRGELITLAKKHSLDFETEHNMPANNNILVWRKTT